MVLRGPNNWNSGLDSVSATIVEEQPQHTRKVLMHQSIPATPSAPLPPG